MIGELTRHLWQSTFFAVAAGILTLAFRKNRAQVRYWLWLSASLKFFVPFALLMSLGSDLETRVPAAHKIATRIATPAISYTIDQFSEPSLPGSLPSQPTAPAMTHWIPVAFLGLWLCGFAAISLVRFRNWVRVRSAIRMSYPVDVQTAVEVRASSGLLEPGVVGLWRPTLLLPEGIEERLSPSELKAVLAHELCHVRRRDNLFASIHMVVETMFWFHPLVWMIGARLLEERERACDEEVLRLGNQPDVYADAILNVCKLYVESPLACVSGVSGAGIRRRVEAIMTNRKAHGLNRAKKFLLTAAGVAALAGPVAIGVVIGVGNAPAIHAQSPARPLIQTSAAILAAPVLMAQAAPVPKTSVVAASPQSASAISKPKFDVASIKPCNPGAPVMGRGGATTAGSPAPNGLGGYFGRSPGRLDISCGSIMSMVNIAYVMNGDVTLTNSPKSPGNSDQHIKGVPDWAMSARYTIEAETDDPVANGPTDGPNSPAWNLMVGPMLQSLLEDRFHLKIHEETEEIPMYNLVVAKGGLKLKPMEDGECQEPETGPGGRGTIIHTLQTGEKPFCHWMGGDPHGPNRTVLGGGVPISRLSDFLSLFVMDRHVIDKTGLTTVVNIHLEYAPDDNTPCEGPPGRCEVNTNSDVPGAPSIFTAIEQQLGLKLESTKGPHGYIAIDHVERPSEN
jgi:bla regulator protein blaR1